MSGRVWVAALAGVIGMALGAGEAQAGFRPGTILPNREAVLAAVDHGQGGREVMDAVFRGDRAAVERLVHRDPQLAKASDGKHFDLLSVAVGRGDVAMVHALLALGAPPNGPHGEVPLGLALRADSPELAQALLDGGASPNPAGPHAIRPLDEAVLLDSKGAVRLLLDKGADPNAADAVGSTPLITACSTGRAAIALVLLDHGADPWVVGVNGDTAADYLRTAPKRGGEDAAALPQLVARLTAAGAWPAIAAQETRRLVLKGAWPPPQAKGKGRKPAPQVVETMRANWSEDGTKRGR